MSSSNTIGVVVGTRDDKEIIQTEAAIHGLSTSAFMAETVAIDRSGPRPLVVPRRLTPESIYVGNDQTGHIGTLASILAGRPDGRAPERASVGSPADVVISPQDAGRAILARVLAGSLELGPPQIAVLEFLRSKPAGN